MHCVANAVSSESCANLLLALGASPIMAHAPEEMAAVTAAAQATVLNTGTPDAVRWSACRTCLRAADHPVVLDPVGVGVSPWRKTAIRQLLAIRSPAILRVNAGEAQTLLGMDSRSQGVDCPEALSRDQAAAWPGASPGAGTAWFCSPARWTLSATAKAPAALPAAPR